MAENKKRKKKVQFAYKCIFCGSVGATFQHVIPNWITNRYPVADMSYTQMPHVVNTIGPDTVLITPSLQFHNRPMGSKKTKIVCKTCNNGWMSLVENRARDVVIGLIEVENYTLTNADKRYLSAWLMLASIIFEYDQPETKVVPARDRTYLKEHLEAPENWDVWVGKTNSESYKRRFRHTCFGEGLPPGIPGSNINVHARGIFQHTILGINKTLFITRSMHAEHLILLDAEIMRAKFVKVWPLDTNVDVQFTVNEVSNDEVEDVFQSMTQAQVK